MWDVPDGVVSKAFRKASLRVHPDQNPSEEAKIAFDKLSDANRALRDPARRGEALRKFATKAFNEKCRLDPAGRGRGRTSRITTSPCFGLRPRPSTTIS